MTGFPMDIEVPREPMDRAARKFGRPLVIPVNGTPGGRLVPYTRCTTFIDCLDDKFALQKWQQRMVALGLSQRQDLLAAYAAIAADLMTPQPDPGVKAKADAICSDALEAAAGNAAATTGTALHALTERLDRGQPLGTLPDTLAADVAAYEKATAQFTALHIERFLVNDELKVGGTPDRVVTYEGTNYIADLKTGSVEWGALKIAMQLGLYSRSRLYNPATGDRADLPDVDQSRAIVVHLPAGTGQCRLQWVDIAQGWEAVGVAKAVREWRNRGRGLMKPLHLNTDEALPAPPDPAYQALRNEVASAATVERLGVLWREHRAQWNDELTHLAAGRKAVLTTGGTR